MDFRELLLEAEEQKVYTNDNGQSVYFSNHAWNDRLERKWWDDCNDDEFLKYIIPALETLANKDKKELHYRDEYAIVSKDGKKGFIISLRPNLDSGRYDSFAIVTILNRKNKELYINVPTDNKIILESKSIIILCEV